MIKILFLAANPLDTPRVRFDQEFRDIAAALRSGEYRDSFDLVPHLALRVSDLQEQLLRHKPDIVHFSGYGSQTNEIILQDEYGNSQPVPGYALERLFSILKDNLRCVVLNACYTAEQGAAIARQVDCVIAVPEAISDQSSVKFAKAFYQALGFGRDVKTAFDLGCNQLELEQGEGTEVPQLLPNDEAARTVTLVSALAVADLSAKEYLVAPDEIRRNEDTFVPPTSFEVAFNQSEPGRVHWIVGPPGIGKRSFALALARKWLSARYEYKDGWPLYSFPRQVDWSRIGRLHLQRSAIVLPDTLGAVSFDREQVDGELAAVLSPLANAGNLVIATCPRDVYDEAKARTRRLSEWLAANALVTEIDAKSYSAAARDDMFNRLLTYAKNSNALTKRPYELASTVLKTTEIGAANSELIEQARRLLLRFLHYTWIPLDVDRFIFGSLPSARKWEDLIGLLQQGSDIDSRIRTWFGALDLPTQSFVFTLALFSGLDDRSLWLKYMDVVRALHRLNPALPILPLGILRQRAAPHVTASGPLDFLNSSVHRAVIREISFSYRDYFLELRDKITMWSVPAKKIDSGIGAQGTAISPRSQTALQPSSSEDDTIDSDQAIATTEPVRNAIARVVGEIAKQCMEDVLPILDTWGSHTSARVGRATGIALSETVTDPTKAETVLRFLHRWAIDFSPDGARNRRRSAASSFGQVSLNSSQPDIQDYALQDLQLLAGDPNDIVKCEVAFFTGRLAGALPLSRIAPVLSRLARAKYEKPEQEQWAYEDMARAVDQAARKERDAVLRLIESWVTSDSARARRTGGYMLLSCRRLEDRGRYDLLHQLLTAQPEGFVRVLVLCTSDSDNSLVWQVLHTLASKSSKGARQALVEGLAVASTTSQLDVQSLRLKLQERLPNEAADLLFDVDILTECARITRLCQSNPASVVDALGQIADQNEVFALAIVTRLAQMPPDGMHSDLVSALADRVPSASESWMKIDALARSSSDGLVAHIPYEVNELVVARTADKWYDHLTELCQSNSNSVVDQLTILYNGDEKFAQSVTSRLAQEPPQGIRPQLISALADGALHSPANYANLSKRLLEAADGSISGLPGEVNVVVQNRRVDQQFRFLEGLIPASLLLWIKKQFYA